MLSMTDSRHRLPAGKPGSRWTLAVLLLLVIAGCDKGANKAPEAPPPGVLVAKVQNRAISETVEYVGRTLAVNDALLRAQVGGYLLERRFEEGDDIEQDAELFIIDPEVYEAEVAVAEGKVAQVKAALARASKDVKRYRILVKKQSISEQRLDEAESEMLQEEANLMSAEAALRQAQIDLSHTIIRAPFSGRIGRSGVSIGELVTPQTDELARLVELDPIYANFSVSERDVIAAKRSLQAAGSDESELTKLEVTLRLPDGNLYEHIGRLDFIDNVVDRKTGTVIVRAKFPNPDRLLVPGLYVSTRLGSEETTDKLVIPQSAVQEDQAGKFVMVVGPESKVEQRRIETGDTFAGELVVRSGLNPDEQVIVQGIQKVRPGILVDAKLAPQPGAENIKDSPQATEPRDDKTSNRVSAEDRQSRPLKDQEEAPTTAIGTTDEVLNDTQSEAGTDRAKEH